MRSASPSGNGPSSGRVSSSTDGTRLAAQYPARSSATASIRQLRAVPVRALPTCRCIRQRSANTTAVTTPGPPQRSQSSVIRPASAMWYSQASASAVSQPAGAVRTSTSGACRLFRHSSTAASMSRWSANMASTTLTIGSFQCGSSTIPPGSRSTTAVGASRGSAGGPHYTASSACPSSRIAFGHRHANPAMPLSIPGPGLRHAT